MSSLLESLPNELLEAISKQFDDMQSWANLCRCSRHLHQALRDHPYRESSVLRNRIVLYSCTHGNTHNLRRAISYGASPTVVDLESSDIRVWGERGKGSTLCLSLMEGQPDVFNKLLELGAETIWPDTGTSVFEPYRQFLFHLSQEPYRHVALCTLFSSASLLGIEEKLKERASDCLIEAIRKGASPKTVDTLLYFVDDLNKSMHATWSVSIVTSLLLAAASVGSVDIFDLLLERGADLTMLKHPFHPGSFIYHPPIFEAASALARYGSTDMIQKCIHHRVPIDIRYESLIHWSRINDIPPFATILSVYLVCIEDWEKPTRVRPVDGVKYILSQFEANGGLCGDQKTTNSPQEIPQRIARETLDWLLYTKSLVDLAFDEYFHVVQYLAEYAPQGLSSQQLVFADPGCKFNGNKKSIVEKRWCVILSKLLRSTDASEKDRLLYEYILDRGMNFPHSKLQPLISITCLTQVGANINAFHKVDDGEDDIALHNLCKRYQAQFEYSRLELRKAFLRILIRAGANPLLKLDGGTAIDHLEMGCWKINKKAKRARFELIDILKNSHISQK